MDSIFQASESRAIKRALDVKTLAEAREGASMLVYLAPNFADDAIVARILWDDSAQAAVVASMSAFRTIVCEYHTKYFNESTTAPMYLKLIPVRYPSRYAYAYVSACLPRAYPLTHARLCAMCETAGNRQCIETNAPALVPRGYQPLSICDGRELARVCRALRRD